MKLPIAKSALSAVTSNPLVGFATNLLGIGSLAKRLRPPSGVRAAGQLARMLPSALGGNLTAVRAIVFRAAPDFPGIPSERAVWARALAGIPAPLVRQANARAAELDALVDHSNPETTGRTAMANPRMAGSSAASSFALPITNLTGSSMPAVGELAPTESRARAKKGRTHVRYNPSTGARTLVPIGSEEDASWPSRKPKARSPVTGRPTTKAAAKVERRALTNVTRAAERAVSTGALKAAGAVAAAGRAAGLGAGLTVAYLTAAGLASYAATTVILNGLAEGVTARNILASAISQAHTRVVRQLGREMTKAEYTDMRQRIAQRLGEALNMPGYGTIERAVRSVISLIRGR